MLEKADTLFFSSFESTGLDVKHPSVYMAVMAMYTTKDAAEKLVLAVSHLRRLLETGKMKGKKFGRDWVVLSMNCKRKRGQSHESS